MLVPRRYTRLAGGLLCLALFLSAASPAQQFSNQLYNDMQWRMIGPFRGGRTVAVSGVPGQPNVFYMAAVNGGIWKTTDYGEVWKPIFDSQPSNSVGALAVAPSNPNILYAGSGEGLERPDLATGDGMYKSLDAGESWQHLGLRDGQQINAVVVDPGDPNRVFVAVMGHPYGPNEERGIFRSLDGGQSWKKVLYKDENAGGITVALDPGNPQTVYAALWAARRPPWTTGNAINYAGSGLFKSTDGGDTWHPLTQGLPTPEQGLGRVGIGIANSDPQRIFALADAPDAGGLFRSDDGGESWVRVNHESRIWGRGSDFAGVTVAPDNKDTVYAANTSTYRSTDAGKTFSAIKGAPGGDDYHTVWIPANNPQVILLGSDQGATISVNGGRTWSSWYNQPTAQFYHVITDNRFPYWVYGSQQESGSIGTASRSDYGEITFRDWHTIGSEEYGYVAPDPQDPNILYGGKAFRFNQTTGQAQDISPAVLKTGKYRFNRTAPLIFSAAPGSHVLYLASQMLLKTVDGGNHWEPISPDLTREDPGIPPNLGSSLPAAVAAVKHRGVIYAVAPSPLDASIIWAGTDDGLIHMTRDGGAQWQNVTPPELTPWSKVAQLEASRFDRGTAYAAINRFRLDDLHAWIYRTHDGGKNWRKITAGIPDNAAVNTVREDPVRRGLLFAGTERGIYVSFNDGDQWQPLQLNLPPTSMRDLVVHDDDIVVGTHGRSFWILDDITPLREITREVSAARAHLFKPANTWRVRRSVNTDTPYPPELPAGKNPPDGAIIDYYLGGYDRGGAAKEPVVLEVFNSAGKLVRRFASNDHSSNGEPDPTPNDLTVPSYWVRPARVLPGGAGMHRWVWDLHYPAPGALDHEYPISAIYGDTPRSPQGPRALPGNYTVKLTAGGRSYTQPLTVKMDPRIPTPPAEWAQQFAAESEITGLMNQSYEAAQSLKQAREQLKKLQSTGVLADSIKAVDDEAAALETKTEGPLFKGGSLAEVNTGLGTLLSVVDSADATPTSQAQSALADLRQAFAMQWTRCMDFQSHLATLNGKLKSAGLAVVQ